MKVVYDSNNSGGDWWLSDGDWENLEKDGWNVRWEKDIETKFIPADKNGRWLGPLATRASIDIETVEDQDRAIQIAIKRWEKVTGQDHTEQGCNCCGEPHRFYTEP